jgi:hypothetical protein
MKKISSNQIEFLNRLSKGTILKEYCDSKGRFLYYIESPYSFEDSRTVKSCYKRNLILWEGGKESFFILSPLGKKILQDLNNEN